MGAAKEATASSIQADSDVESAGAVAVIAPLSTASETCIQDLEKQELVSHDETGKSLALSTRSEQNSTRTNEYAALFSDPTKKVREGDGAPLAPPQWRTELMKVWVLSGPIVLTYVLEFLPGVVSIMLVGRMDSPLTKEYVDAATLSSMFIYLSGEAPGFGMATALDTLCSQAYGAGKPLKIGISFQTGVLVLTAVLIPVFWLNWNSDYILTVLHQPEEVTGLAGEFSRWLLLGLPFLFLYELLKKVLQAQNIVQPMVWIAVLSNIVNVALGVYLTWYTPLGFHGAAIARSISNIVLPLATVPYFMWRPHHFRSWWPGFQPKAVMRHLCVFLQLGIPGMIMLVIEWLSYEVMAVFAGYLPDSVVAISVHSVLSNIANIAFHFFIGVGVATNVLVGNYVGSGDREHAKLVSNLGILVSLAIGVFLVLIILLLNDELPTIFINDEVSISLASVAVLYLIPFELLDAANCVMQGIFRGTGRQTFAAVVNFIAYFVIGLPLGFVLGYYLHMGVQGFWLGLTIGYVFSVSLQFYKIYRTDWVDMVKQAQDRTDT